MKKIIISLVVIATIGLIVYGIKSYRENAIYRNPAFASGNGRLEATEVNIAAKLAGKIEKILVKEGDYVKKGQKLVFMQTNVLQANMAQAKAMIRVKESELVSAKATLMQKISLCQNATIQQAKAAVLAAKADAARIQADIDDSTLIAPLEGRIQYRISEEGEVLNAGGKVLNLVDLTDVYLTFFLPEAVAGRVQIGADVRLIMDALPSIPIPAKVSFVASVAQFTPKTVETKIERQKLMFRIKAKIDPQLLRKYIDMVKTGLPGVAWVRMDDQAEWPDFLQRKESIPQAEQGVVRK